MDAVSSSPDPLNDSPNGRLQVKSRRVAKPRQSLPLRGSSPNKQTFELDVGQRISPQKIRVTVEAGNSDTEQTRRPIARQREHTTTTTIPVKGLSDSEEDVATTPKRGRGRPRKSAGTPVKKSGRVKTPTKKDGARRRSVGTLVDGDDQEDTNFRLGGGVDVGRGKGRSRSRSAKAPVRGRRKTLLPDEVIDLEHDASRHTVMDKSVATQSAESPSNSEDLHSAASSTISSIATNGGNGEDITIARFDPGEQTPRKTGWSSPRVSSERASTSPQRIRCNPSPSASPEKAVEEGEDQVEQDYLDEEADVVGHLPEFDTILESEEFSMISVDSVPSLREHISSPASNFPSGTPNQGLLNKGLQAVQDMNTATGNDSFSSIPEAILEAATPRRVFNKQSHLCAPNSAFNDSFSSIPPSVLEAATPGRRPGASSMEREESSRVGGVLSNIAVLGESAHSDSDSTRQQHGQQDIYADSFSAIPSAVLEAATPAQVRQPFNRVNTSQVSHLVRNSDAAGSSQTKPFSLRSNRRVSASRLPTPESPTTNVSHEDKGSSSVPFVDNNISQEPRSRSPLKSSPPTAPRRYTYTAHLRHQRDLFPDQTQTPSIVFSSPSLPPPIKIANSNLVLDTKVTDAPKAQLSPIVRAGRALQGITIPSSPRARAFSLGSPFKSPVSDRKTSSSARHGSHLSPLHERAGKPLPRLDLAGDLATRDSQPGSWSASVHDDDPFGNYVTASQRRSPSPEDKQTYALGLPKQHPIMDLRKDIAPARGEQTLRYQADGKADAQASTKSTNRRLRAGLISPDEEGSTAANPTALSAGKVASWEPKEAAEKAATSQTMEATDRDQVITIESDNECSLTSSKEDEEDFGLLLETLNSSTPAKQASPQAQKSDDLSRPPRSKIPSPWRKNSKRLVYADELSQSRSSPPASTQFQASLMQQSSGDAMEETDSDLEISEYAIPQNAEFRHNRPSLDLSALLGSSPDKNFPVRIRSNQEKAIRSKSSSQPGISTKIANDRGSSDVPRSQRFETIPEKRDFLVQNRQNIDSSMPSSSPFKQSKPATAGLFGIGLSRGSGSDQVTPEITSSSSAVEPLGHSSPSRSNTLRKLDSPVHDQRPKDPKPMFPRESQENEEMPRNWTAKLPLTSAPIQIPLSPTKSCLRSPMKTPKPNSGYGLSPSKNVAFVSSSPIPSPPAAKLSSTTWSHDHWVLLDSIIQTWKPQNQNETLSRSRRNSTRVISKLLGKTVSSQGAKMKLEQWHLEAVDDFRGCVPGWLEKDIAKRVFACLLGEERRASGGAGYEFE